MKKFNAQKIFICMFVFLIAFALAGCGEGMESVADNKTPGGNYTNEEIANDSETTSSDLPEDRKLIQKVNMSVETEDLDKLLSNLDKRISELGGYVETSNIENGSAYSNHRFRSATMTIRIPAKSFNSFINKVSELSNVVSSKKTVEDITLNYVATEGRMKALQAEEARLLQFMAKAETMNDLLTVEKRLTEVRAELETVTSALRVYDNQVNYSTINLTINEVKEYTDVTEPETVWQRISTGFVNSVKNIVNFFKELFIFLVVASPYLILLAIVPVTIIIIIKLNNRKRIKANKNNKKE
ncbi:MAG: DUF4349 domain-containing protein [Ruminococcaceae bacterium]|nr:DUF4349 domain-containing protein [Oscillospiraceae bacterium]